MVKAAVEQLPVRTSLHKRTKSNPFKILSTTQKVDKATVESCSPSKGSPKKYLTRSRTDPKNSAEHPQDGDAVPLGELQNGQQRPSRAESDQRPATLHKRTKSAISLKSFAGSDKSKSSTSDAKHPLESLQQFKKSKSSTNLAAIFSRPKSRGRNQEGQKEETNKENTKPSSTQSVEAYTPTPIWAQFASTGFDGAASNGLGKSAANSPSKSPRIPFDESPARYTELKSSSRVQAAVAAYNGKTEEAKRHGHRREPSKRTNFDAEVVNTAFEALLEARNIPADVREKMRTLETALKADFIQKNQHTVSPTIEEKEPERGRLARSFSSKRPRTRDADAPSGPSAMPDSTESPKKPRSRGFTLTRSKDDQSPTKKHKSGRSISRSRPKSVDLPRSWSSTSLVSLASASPGRQKTQKQSTPEDFITYFRSVQKPQDVEVGRLQKLRQLLRNETVAWVETFVALGGMEEVVLLLHRIIKIEWREEHEDALMHNALSCIKALATTSSGLEHLAIVQKELFPALLKLLFSSGEEKKGPSEFTTRGLIVSLLFAYLQSGPDATPPERVATLLGYLRDPQPADTERPPDFMLGMHRPRPYKVWVGEMSNVTKEVFWIFLHHVNVIPYPNLPARLSYLDTHFPPPRPPVAAAPYVGGVEWDATNYLAAHLDLMNGMIASLPTADQRNELRRELRDSGNEKVLGASLRTCKEKFYGAVHACLSTYIGAARADGWDPRMVREGPTSEERARRSPAKRRKDDSKENAPPMLAEIKMDAGPKLGLQIANPDTDNGQWL